MTASESTDRDRLIDQLTSARRAAARARRRALLFEAIGWMSFVAMASQIVAQCLMQPWILWFITAPTTTVAIILFFGSPFILNPRTTS